MGDRFWWWCQRSARANAQSSLEASRLANLRYREGVEDFLTVLDAERSQLEIEDQYAQSQIAVAQFLASIKGPLRAPELI